MWITILGCVLTIITEQTVLLEHIDYKTLFKVLVKLASILLLCLTDCSDLLKFHTLIFHSLSHYFPLTSNCSVFELCPFCKSIQFSSVPYNSCAVADDFFYLQELPDIELYCPPVTIRCVDCRNFGRFVLVGTHVINNIHKFMYIPQTRKDRKHKSGELYVIF